ncbi:hypothetical protein ABI59_04425 [Acidobacteria bacterium Mor1]|nr:hypothetical protein ABI59_04425 [Acidobacteria bacterium Mor1]
MHRLGAVCLACVALLGAVSAIAQDTYTNYESAHVNPIALTPSGSTLLAVNTPDARLETFSVGNDGSLTHSGSIPVGLEPVTVVVRSETEAWVVNHLSDSISIVDLVSGTTVETLDAGDEPVDAVFAGGKAFVALAGEDAVVVFDLADLTAAPQRVDLFTDDPRALAVSLDGTEVYAVALRSGNETTVISANVIANNESELDSFRLGGLNDIECDGNPPAYPGLPTGITRNPALPTPDGGGLPIVGLIVKYNRATGNWEDENGTSWNNCLPISLPDQDLFRIDVATLAVTSVSHLGTSLFDVSVRPGTGEIYVPHTEARNEVRFEHELGVRGHVVDNRIAIVTPGDGSSTILDLNDHIDRNSDPATNLAEREASVSQPGMMVWRSDGSAAYMTAIGSRKVFRLDGACRADDCVFGADRNAPAVVEAGEGPTGVALNEGDQRLYVLNRFSNSVATVDIQTMTVLSEDSLHDPSSDTIKNGRRLLYDGILSSGHGDASCATCHLFGDMDGLAWDLGDPEGEYQFYTDTMDNVRFIKGTNNGTSRPCDPVEEDDCFDELGFDPEKGPMTTQTFRGMLEPLHWRGDRPTMRDFNKAFVGLLGAEDIGPINGAPAGLTAQQMDLFREFTLGIRFPPNPFRDLDDSIPNQLIFFPDRNFTGNPKVGENLFLTEELDGRLGGLRCTGCHSLPFGTAGGVLGGVEPTEPTSLDTAGLFNGDSDKVPHSDMKVAHLRNMYEKLGPTFGDYVTPPVDSKTGFGFSHDGTIPTMRHFLAGNPFDITFTAQQVRDVSAFMLHFQTGTKPSVGASVTVPAGTPPTGTTAEENVISTLVALGDLADANRHCELIAYGLDEGRVARAHLSGGLWERDRDAAAISLTTLRENADGEITFLCAPLGSGARLGGDRDADGVRDFDDCSEADPTLKAIPGVVDGLAFDAGGALIWNRLDDQAGSATLFDVAGGRLSDLLGSGFANGTCLAGGLADATYVDSRPLPPVGDGDYYLIRGINACGDGNYGAGREALEPAVCP